MSTQAIIEKLVKQKKSEVTEETIQAIVEKTKTRRKNTATSKNAITVGGVDSMKTELSTCCSPIYGDDIVGYVTRGRGIKVHRKDCPNIMKEKARLIDVMWDENVRENKKYDANIKIYSKDRNFLLTDLVTCVSQYKSNLLAVNSTVNKDDLTATTKMTIVVDDIEHLQVIIANLRKINNVIDVERVIK